MLQKLVVHIVPRIPQRLYGTFKIDGVPKHNGRQDQVEGVSRFSVEQQTLLTFGGERFTIGDACTGVQVFGGTGSGKTSGSGRALAYSYLAYGFGGLVLCAKPEERALWEKLAKATARENDLILFDASGDRYRLNFIDYESRSNDGAGVTTNLVQLLADVAKAIDREEKDAGEKPFWKNAGKQLTTSVIELATFAKMPPRFDYMPVGWLSPLLSAFLFSA